MCIRDRFKAARKNAVDEAFTTGRRKKARDMDKVLAPASDKVAQRSVYQNELQSDPKRIGFAYGGVDPGRLHAHGQLVETHKVHYSIGMCGVYRLHVALRNPTSGHEAAELPGSPFLLRVTAGPASALSTWLPQEALPLHGIVGSEWEKTGCAVHLQVSDRMGNRCSTGGASVECLCPQSDDVESRVIDHDDGLSLIHI